MEGNYPSAPSAPKTGQAMVYSCGLCFKEFLHYHDLALHERMHLEEMARASGLQAGVRPGFDNTLMYSGAITSENTEKVQPFRGETELHVAADKTSHVERPQPYQTYTSVRLLDTRAVTPVSEAVSVAAETESRSITHDSRSISMSPHTVMTTQEQTVLVQQPTQSPLAVQTNTVDQADIRSSYIAAPVDARTLSYTPSQYLDSLKAAMTPSIPYTAHQLLRHEDVFSNTEPRNVLPKMDSQIYPNPDPYYNIIKGVPGSMSMEKIESPAKPPIISTPVTIISHTPQAYYQHVRPSQDKESSPNSASYINSPLMQSPRVGSTESAESHKQGSPESLPRYYMPAVSTPSSASYLHPDLGKQSSTPTGTVPYLHHDQSRYVSTPSTIPYMQTDPSKFVSAPSGLSYLHQDIGKQVSPHSNMVSYLPYDISKHMPTAGTISYLPHDVSKQQTTPSVVPYLPYNINRHGSLPGDASYLPSDTSKQTSTSSTLPYTPHDISKHVATPTDNTYLSHDISKHVATPATISYLPHNISKHVSSPSIPGTISYRSHGVSNPVTVSSTGSYLHYSNINPVSAASPVPYVHEIGKHASVPSTISYLHHSIGKPHADSNTMSHLPHTASKQASPTQLPRFAYMPLSTPEQIQLTGAGHSYTVAPHASDVGPTMLQRTTSEHPVLSVIQAHTAHLPPDTRFHGLGSGQPYMGPSQNVTQATSEFKTHSHSKHEQLGKIHESLDKTEYPEKTVSQSQHNTNRLMSPVTASIPQMVTMHNDSAVSSDCSYCSMTFPSLKDLSAHLAIHEQERMMQKSRDSINYQNPSSNISQNTFTMGKDLVLRAGEGKFSSSSVESPGNIVCNICLKSFQHTSHLLEHMHIHKAEQAFVCKFCHKAFTKKSQCLRHELSHQHTDGLIHCEMCDMGFQNKSSYLFHIKNHGMPVKELEKQNTENTPPIVQQDSESTTAENKHDNHDNVNQFDDLIKLSLDHMETLRPEKTKNNSFEKQAGDGPSSLTYGSAYQPVTNDMQGNIIQDQRKTLDEASNNADTEDNVIDCPVCDSEMDKSELDAHMNTHSLHMCQQCERAFIEKSEYVEHLMTFHWKDLVEYSDDENRNIGSDSPVKVKSDGNDANPSNDQDLSLARNLESETENIKQNIKLLLKKRPENKPEKDGIMYTCTVCNTTFKFKGEYKKHELAHKRDARSVVCELCDTSFYEKANYLYHMHEHCQEQDEESEEDDDTEMNSTESQNVVTCVTCHAAIEKGRLIEHMKIHIKFVCESCEKGFTHRRNYAQHLKSVHGEEIKEEDFPKAEMDSVRRQKRTSSILQVKEHICELCTRSFSTRSKLNRHVASHSKKLLPVFTCEICKKTFYDKGNYLYHLRKHEPTDLGKLSKESEIFVKKIGLFPTSTTCDNSQLGADVTVPSPAEANARIDEYADANLDSIDSGITSDEGDLEDRIPDSKLVEAASNETSTKHQYLDEKTGNIVDGICDGQEQPSKVISNENVGNIAVADTDSALVTECSGTELSSKTVNVKGSGVKTSDNERIENTEDVMTDSNFQKGQISASNEPHTSENSDYLMKSQDIHKGTVRKDLIGGMNTSDLRECDFCKKYVVKTFYIYHLKLHKINECDTCMKSFTRKRSYVQHMRAAHKKDLLERGADENFNKEFREAASISGVNKKGKSNTEKVTESQPMDDSTLMCPICCIACIDKDAYSEHTKVHQSEKFVCSACAREFSKRSSLVLHEATHDYVAHSKKGLPYPRWCPVCKIAIQSYRHYMDHSRIHTGERPYKCPDCDLDFKRNRNLELHLKKQHNKDIKVTGMSEGKGVKFDIEPSSSPWNNDGTKAKIEQRTAHGPEDVDEESIDSVEYKRHAKNPPTADSRKKHRKITKLKSNASKSVKYKGNDSTSVKYKANKKMKTTGFEEKVKFADRLQNIGSRKASRNINYNEVKIQKANLTKIHRPAYGKKKRTRRSIKHINYNEDDMIERNESQSNSEINDTVTTHEKERASRNKGIIYERGENENIQPKRRTSKNVTYNERAMFKQSEGEACDVTHKFVGRPRKVSRDVNYKKQLVNQGEDEGNEIDVDKTVPLKRRARNEISSVKEIMEKKIKLSVDDKSGSQTSNHKRSVSRPMSYTETETKENTEDNSESADTCKIGRGKRMVTLKDISYSEKEIIKRNKVEQSDTNHADKTSAKRKSSINESVSMPMSYKEAETKENTEDNSESADTCKIGRGKRMVTLKGISYSEKEIIKRNKVEQSDKNHDDKTSAKRKSSINESVSMPMSYKEAETKENTEDNSESADTSKIGRGKRMVTLKDISYSEKEIIKRNKVEQSDKNHADKTSAKRKSSINESVSRPMSYKESETKENTEDNSESADTCKIGRGKRMVTLKDISYSEKEIIKRNKVEQSDQNHADKTSAKRKSSINESVSRPMSYKEAETKENTEDNSESADTCKIGRGKRMVTLKDISYSEKEIIKRNKVEQSGQNHADKTSAKRKSSINESVSRPMSYKEAETKENTEDNSESADTCKIGRGKRMVTLKDISYSEKEIIKRNKVEQSDQNHADKTSAKRKSSINDSGMANKSEEITFVSKNYRKKKLVNSEESSKQRARKGYLRHSRRIKESEATMEDVKQYKKHSMCSKEKLSSPKSKSVSKKIKDPTKESGYISISDHLAEMGLTANHVVVWAENAHGQSYPKHCPQCHLLIRSHNHYIEHSRCHTGIRPFLCPFCDHGFSAERYRDRHQKTCKDAVKENKTEKREASESKKKSRLSRHYKYKNSKTVMCKQIKHKQANINDPNNSSIVVTSGKDELELLDTANTKRSKNLPFTCESCGMSFKKKTDLYIHTKYHLGDEELIPDNQHLMVTVETAECGSQFSKDTTKCDMECTDGNVTQSLDVGVPMDLSETHAADDVTKGGFSDTKVTNVEQSLDENAENKTFNVNICTSAEIPEPERVGQLVPQKESKTIELVAETIKTQTSEITIDTEHLNVHVPNKHCQSENHNKIESQMDTLVTSTNESLGESSDIKQILVSPDYNEQTSNQECVNNTLSTGSVETMVAMPSSNNDRNGENCNSESGKDIKSLKVNKMSSESAMSKWKAKVHDVLSSQLELNNKRPRATGANKQDSKPDMGESDKNVDRNAEPSKFECRICGDMLNLEDEFIAHMDIHLQEMPPYCHICDIYFMAIYPKRRLIEHNKKKHSDVRINYR